MGWQVGYWQWHAGYFTFWYFNCGSGQLGILNFGILSSTTGFPHSHKQFVVGDALHNIMLRAVGCNDDLYQEPQLD